MTKQVQRRRGTSTQHTSFTGAEGELSVNTTNKSVHVHDGVTAGGVEAARADMTNVTDANLNARLNGNTLSSLTITTADINGGTIDGTVIGGTTPAAITGTTGTFSGNLTVDTNTLFVDAANNRVGVGTSSPSFELDVVGVTDPSIRVRATGASSSDDALLRMTVGNADASNFIQFGDNSDSDAGYIRYQHASDSLQIGVNAAERMRITSAGLAGIGTSSPAEPLHVVGTVRSDVSSTGDFNFTAVSTGGGQYRIYPDDATTANPTWLHQSNSSEDQAWVIGGVERMRIDSSGNLLVGTTDVAATAGAGVKLYPGTDGAIAVVGATSTSANSTYALYSTGAGAYRFYVTYSGAIHATSTSITAISDASLKENIRDLETGLGEVMALRPRRFDWKNGDGENVAGFIAQEVEAILPELVYDYKYNEAETKKALKMGDILPTLVKAIQELKAEVDSLRAQLNP